MIEICAIASGSNGNCYYVGNETEAVLIDLGISTKQAVQRMVDKGIDLQKIKAVFVSHEHADHVRGVRVFSKRHNIPVYFTAQTYLKLSRRVQPNSPRFFKPGESISIGSIMVHSFLKNHDAVEPCSFRIEVGNKHVGVFTDIGEPCENLQHHFTHCQAVFLETNYDEPMLMNGPYPYYLKQRVGSKNGHLSNIQALNLVQERAGEELGLIFLSHISAENNTPELAMQSFDSISDKYDVRLTSRYAPTDVVRID